MEDVGRLAGKVTIEFNGADYTLQQATIETWGTLQNLLVREKRSRIVQSALDLRGSLPESEFVALKRDALNEAGNIQSLSQRDMQELMSTDAGFAILVWVLFDQSYPGKFTREQVRGMLKSGVITEADGIEIASQIEQALNVGKSGNSDGQTNQDQS